MKVKLHYPVNGCDLELTIYGSVSGPSPELCLYEVSEITAKLGPTKVFIYDGEQKGLLANTQIAEEIFQFATSQLIDIHYEQVPADY